MFGFFRKNNTDFKVGEELVVKGKCFGNYHAFEVGDVVKVVSPVNEGYVGVVGIYKATGGNLYQTLHVDDLKRVSSLSKIKKSSH